ncbi:hypothetical protein [uncultured Corynebacterium sp.]|uniref:hypothetical protein n=1 Tax=uncultured Corynebacterium sp. TaxID=159447 RepID=UPI0025E1D71E|nr:hypothetical protein [uncultured Corynebacterium sp.]
MSNQYPYGNDGYDDQTRQYRRDDFGQSPYQQDGQHPQSQNYRQPRYQEQYQDSYEDQGPSLLAGKFEAKKVSVNLVLLGVLSAIVTFAVVLIVDQLIAAVSDTVALGPGAAVIHGVVAGIVGVLAGLLYIPVSGTGNEGLFNAAIIALTIAAAVFDVIFGGLLDKDWSKLLSLAAILCAGITAYAAPSRIETARVR